MTALGDTFDRRRTQLKPRRNNYPVGDVNELLEFARTAIHELGAQNDELAARVAGLDNETDEDRRNRVLRAAMAQQAAETIVDSAEQESAVRLQATKVQCQRMLEETHRRAALIQPAGGLPAKPDATGDQVQDALLEAEWLDHLRAFTADAAEALRPKIRDAIAGLQRADAALDGAPALPTAKAS